MNKPKEGNSVEQQRGLSAVLFKFLEYIKVYETVYKHFELIKTVDTV